MKGLNGPKSLIARIKILFQLKDGNKDKYKLKGIHLTIAKMTNSWLRANCKQKSILNFDHADNFIYLKFEEGIF